MSQQRIVLGNASRNLKGKLIFFEDVYCFDNAILMLYIQWCAIWIMQNVFIKPFGLFSPPSKRNSITNDTLFESTNMNEEKKGVALPSG